jgi:hypothetical protein
MSKIKMILMLAAGMVPLWSAAQIEFFVAEYTQFMVQTGPDTLVPFGDHTNGFDGNYQFFGSVLTDGSEIITGGTLSGPFGTKDLQLLDDGDEYTYEPIFTTQQEMVAAVPAGTYTFSGTGNTVGAFSQQVTLPSYSPLTNLKVTNFSELQSFDITQPLTIRWEEFTQGQGVGPNAGYAGLIDVEIIGYTESSDFTVWDSSGLIPENAIGPLPTLTQVTIPAGTFNTETTYIVLIFFARIDSGVDGTVPGALAAAVTSYELEFNIYPEGTAPVDTWAGYPVDPLGWADTTPWMAYLNTARAPWIWSASLAGWVWINEGSVTDSGGWVYIPKN